MERNKITYGNLTFLNNEIKNLRCYLTASLLSLSLEYNTLKFEIERDDPTLVGFQQNDSIVYSHNEKQIGTFYVQSVSRIGVTKYRFEAVSKIGILAQKQHAGGIYTGQTVDEVVADIFGDIPYTIKENIKNIKLYGWLPYRKPPSSSARDNLAQVLFAIGATVRTGLDGVPHIEGIFGGTSGYIGKDDIYTSPSVKYGSNVSAVSVLEHQYYADTESKTLFEGTAQDGDIITFDEPFHSLSASGFSILESGANFAKLSSGAGTLTGKRYVHNTRQVSAVINAQATENVKTIENATLVSLVNSKAVLDRVVGFYKCTETIKPKIVLGTQRPCDVVSAYHPYDRKMVRACIESTDIQASGILAATMEALVGYEPPDIAQQDYYDTREVLTGSGVWTSPAGAMSVRAVIIGAGNGGSAGESGGGYSSFSGQYNSLPATIPSKSAGAGGNGGAKGLGGRILVVDLPDIADGAEINYNCGIGGSPGAEGTDTEFGDYTSANGERNDSGYFDTVTGEFFGKSGNDGVRGGDGGSQGQNGESIGDNSGGSGSSSGSKKYSAASGTITATLSWTKAGGGGAATGGPGGTPSAAYGSVRAHTPSSSLGFTFDWYDVVVNRGGYGANGADGADATDYGCGGNGGDGGGGAGESGSVTGGSPTNNSGETLKTFRLLYKSFYASGGSGGNGGSGKDGCVIVYYKTKKEAVPGSVTDKTGRFVLDRTGRLMVV